MFETMLVYHQQTNRNVTLNQLEILNICLKVFFSRIEQSSQMKKNQIGDLLETINETAKMIKRLQYLLRNISKKCMYMDECVLRNPPPDISRKLVMK